MQSSPDPTTLEGFVFLDDNRHFSNNEDDRLFLDSNLFKVAEALTVFVAQDVVEMIVDNVLRRLNGRVQLEPKSRDEVRLAMLIVGGIFSLQNFVVSFELATLVLLSSIQLLYSL